MGGVIRWIFRIGIVVSMVFLCSACFTTKEFSIDSNPKGGLVIQHDNEELDQFSGPPPDGSLSFWKGWSLEICKSPCKAKITFFSDAYFYTVLKRGYTSETQAVTKDSNLFLSFNLKRIEGVSEEIFNKERLSSGTYTLLPVDVEVHIHSGVGNLEKIKLSPDRSEKVSEELYNEIAKVLGTNSEQRIKCPEALSEPSKSSWENVRTGLKKYVSKLSSTRLNYYSYPPYIKTQVEGFKNFSGKLNKQAGGDSPYLLYVGGKCISETTGRKVGSIAVVLLGAAAQGAAMAMHTYTYIPMYEYNPDSGTLIVLYVIDAKTSEVLYIEQRFFPDITNANALHEAAATLSLFPNIPKDKDK